MAKPKFELTADLVKVEPEPNVVISSKNAPEPQDHQKIYQEPKKDTNVSFPALHLDTSSVNQAQYYPAQRSFLQSPQIPPIEQREEEREAISMKIPKDLKRTFHLWCVQRGITMTDAIEDAIKKYLQE